MPLLGGEDTDATEYSSSFGDTSSQNDKLSGASDAEVQSEFHNEDGCCRAFRTRKKKVSSHWRRFIHPLVWRCKWTELRVKELERQAIIYSQEIAANDERKTYQLERFASDLCSKSFPFFSGCIKRRILKRRKRKQVEKMTELTSYTSHHQLFSYLDIKSSDLDSAWTADDIGNVDPSYLIDDIGIIDNRLEACENVLEDVFSQIERVHSRIQGLRTQLDKVVSKRHLKFSHLENLSMLVPYHMPASSANNSPRISACNGDTVSMFELGDLVIPELSSYEEATHVPDIIESTMDLSSTADVDARYPQSHSL